MQDFELEIVTDGLRFPEGPIAMKDGSVIVVEIAGPTITRCLADGRKEIVADVGGGPNGAAIGPDGALYICNNGGFNWHRFEDGRLRPSGRASDYSGGYIQRLDLQSGDLRVLYTATDKAPIRRPNDIVFDAHGGFYFTDFGGSEARSIDKGVVCYAATDGSSIREVTPPLNTPNGVGLSPDGATLYVAESMTCRLWAFDISGPGEIALRRWPESQNGGRFIAAPGGYRHFDSLAVDRAGNICVATLFTPGITVVSPDGASIEHIAMPDTFTTNICFGGPDLSTAYITLSETGRLAKLQWPRPGLRLAFEA